MPPGAGDGSRFDTGRQDVTEIEPWAQAQDPALISEDRSKQMLAIAKRAREEAVSLPALTDLADRAQLVRVAARQADLSLEAQNDWAEFKLDAQRKAGQLLSAMDKAKAAPGNQYTGPLDRSDDATGPTLKDLGVTKDQSSRWQALAALPDEKFEDWKKQVRDSKHEITEAAAIREAARQRRPEPVPGPVPLPDDVFQCVVIDPPWPMQKIERDERPRQGVALDYPVMTLDEIAKLPVGGLAADDCHLYLWVTHKFLPAGLDLIERWGFAYQCVMTWRKNVGFTPFSWMYDTEHVLFARRGNLAMTQLGLRLSFEAPVTGHSVKPDVFYERVIAASPGPRLEMFARRERDGFTPWGNEITNVA